MRKKPQRREERSQGKLLHELIFAMKPDHHIYAIPNGGWRSKSEAVRLKASGVKSGISDLVILAPGWKTYWLEMKDGTNKRSKPSNEQLGFAAICKRLGHPYAVAYSADEALDFLRMWELLKEGY